MLYLLLCLYVSLYYIRPFEWIGSLRGTPIFLVLGVISIIALILASVAGKIRLFRYKTDVMMAGFVGAMILSHLNHGYVSGALDSITKFLPSLVGYFLVAHALDTKKKVEAFVLLLIGLSTFLAYEAYLQSVQGISHGGMEPIIQYQLNLDGVREGLPRVRWFGPFNDPNDLGLALVLPVSFLVDRLLNKKYLVSVLCLPPLLYSLYLTNSRGAMLALAASVFTYLVLRYRSVKGIALGLALAAILVLFGPSRMTQLSGADESAQGRVDAWYAGFQMFKSNPLFGVGKGMFTDYNRLTAHNSYMLVLAEMGVAGSCFFLGLFFYPLRWAKNNLLKEGNSPEREADRCFLVAAFGSLVGLMSAMFFLSRSYILLPFIGIALLTVLINNLPEQADSPVQDQVAEHFHWRTILGLVVVEIVVINLMVKILL